MSDQPQHPTPPPSASSASPPLAGGPSPSALAPPAVFYSVPTATRRSVQTEKLVASSSSSNHNYGPANVVVEKSGLKVLFYKSRTRPGLTLRFPWASERGGMQHFKCDGCQKVVSQKGLYASAVRTVNVQNGTILNDPDRPSGIAHICLHDVGEPTIQSKSTPPVYSVVDGDTRYGPVKRLNALRVAYTSHQFERDLVFAFHRNSTGLSDADEYRCVDCDRLDPTWECYVYVRQDTFIGLDPDYGFRGHCCVANPPPGTPPRNDQDATDPFEEAIFNGADSEWTPASETTSRTASAKNPGRSRRGPKPVKQSFGLAHFLNDAKKRVSYQSKLYPGTELIFSLHGIWHGNEMRASFRCEGCYRFCPKLRQKIACVTLLRGEFVDHDPDLAGTAPHGHLCQKPDVVAQLQVQMRRSSSSKQAGDMSAGGAMRSKEYALNTRDMPAVALRHVVDDGPRSEFATSATQMDTQSDQPDCSGQPTTVTSSSEGRTVDVRRSSQMVECRIGCGHSANDAKRDSSLGSARKRKPLAGMQSSSNQMGGQAATSLGPTARRSSSVRVEVQTDAQPPDADIKPALPQAEEDDDVEILEPNSPHNATDALVHAIAAAANAAPQYTASAAGNANAAVASSRDSSSSSAAEIPELKPPRAMQVLVRDIAAATNAPPQNAASAMFIANVPAATHPAPNGYSSKFGKAIRSDDPTVVFYESLYGVVYKFRLVAEKAMMNNAGVRQVIRTYQCIACQQAKEIKSLQDDIPLVRTIDDVFVGIDPDQPKGNEHLCMQET